MPRENRKRGKKHKKSKEDYEQPQIIDDRHEKDEYEEQPEQTAGPSWIVDRSNLKQEDTDPDAPFGYVDPDVKAYFKTVDDKLREWQELRDVAFDEEEEDPNEERKAFIIAALDELSGKELQLATDPDCSSILERMSYSMDDFVKRVFIDRLAGSYEQLARHRFGSHVVQTLLTISSPTVQREMKGIFPPSPESSPDSDVGELPHLTQLIINVCEELLPSIPHLLNDPFASHVIRALLLLLCPSLTPSDGQTSSIIRSKKSAKHRAKRGPMKSVFANTEGNESTPGAKGKRKEEQTPATFDDMARKIVDSVKDSLNENEIRALAADKSGCPVLVLLLEAEALQGSANVVGSIMDIVSAGLVTLSQKAQVEEAEAADYVSTLLRDPGSSHVMEKLVLLSAEPVFDVLWRLYFQGKLARLAAHPVANFVVARAITRLDEVRAKESLAELEESWPKLIKTSRTGVLKAFVDRSLILTEVQHDVCKGLLEAFGVSEDDDRKLLLSCFMSLKTLADFGPSSEQIKEGAEKNEKFRLSYEPSTQGSLLLQSMLKLSEPLSQHVTDSLISLPVEELISISHNPITSRVLDSFFESPTVPSRTKRRLVMSLIGHFHELVDDRVGSRVGERCWDFADPYLKEKIARSLVPYELTLTASAFGKFFARRLQLPLLKRDTEQWKSSQAKRPATPLRADEQKIDRKVGHPHSKIENSPRMKHDEKPKKRNADEIDEVFAAVGKKRKKGSLAVDISLGPTAVIENSIGHDKGLDSVLGAIRSAPSGKEIDRKKKRR